MFTWIFGIVMLVAMPGPRCVLARGTHNVTTCEEFERRAHFNPYEVIDSMWKIFYFWANTTEVYPIVFTLPARNKLAKFKEVVEATDTGLGIEWQRAALIMTPRPGVEVLMFHATTPGAFRALVKQEQRNKARPMRRPLIKFADVRIKLVDWYMGMMCCEDLTAYALARVDHLPTTEEKCELASATIGYTGPNGRSYLHLQNKDEL